ISWRESFCNILEVYASGESMALATSLRLTFIPINERSAIKIEALIPYSQAFENILLIFQQR
ncbi:MAG: hypothetical protein RBR82_10805, partial [Pseudomonas sp.]|nr:hypothetical protein [Pseudomonas sp.]